MPQRSPQASVDYDQPNHRLAITFAFATPHYGQMQLYKDGNDDDAHPDAILGNVDSAFVPGPCPDQQSGVCYVDVPAPTCFHSHQYKVKIRDCAVDAWMPSNKIPVAAATLDCPVDYNNTNCKQKDDWCPTCPVNNDNCPGAPVNIGSGDVSVNLPLFTIAQSPMPLSFELSYHSLAPSHPSAVSTTISNGWTHNFNASLRPTDAINEPGRLLLVTPHGQRYYFDNVSSSLWVAVKPAGAVDEVDLSGSEYVWKRVDGSEMHFDSATGQWRSSRDRWGNTISGTYTTGFLTTITDSIGRAITLTYQGTALSTIQLPTGETWTLGYSNGNLSSITDPISPFPWRTFAYQADSHGVTRLLTSVRDAGNAILEQHDYDTSDRGVTSLADGGRDAYTIQYDTPSAGRVTITHNVDAMTTRVSTISLLQQNGQYLPTEVDGVCPTCGGASTTQTYTYDHLDQPITRVDGVGITTNYSYDGYGNVISRTEGVGTSSPRTATYRYGDPTWPTLLTQEVDPAAFSQSGGLITTNTWSAANQTMTTTQSGYLTSAGPRTTYTTLSTFDSRHRLLGVDGPRTDVSDVASYAYFADTDPNVSLRGRLHTVTNALNQTTTLDNYDGFGTARKSTDPNGVVTVRTTDARGRTTSVTNQAVPGDANETLDYQTTYTFDTRDRLTETVSPRGLHRRYDYEDGTNRLTHTTLVDLSGNERDRRHVTYDLAGEKILEEDQSCVLPAPGCQNWSTQRDESYKYDSNARLIEVDHGGAKVLYGYDNDGRLISVQDENHTSPNTIYSYDSLHRLTTVTQTLTGAPNNAISTQYDYDAQDNLTSVTDPNGNVTTYAYDDFRRLESQTSPVSGTTSHSYDPSGNLTSSTDANGAATARTYDALNRVTSAVSSGPAPTETVSWTYDGGTYGVGRPTTMTDPTGSTAYSYERRGFLKSEQRALGGATYTTSYGYDPDANRTTLTYPNGGTLTTTFDHANRPSGATGSDGSTLASSVAYLPFGPMMSLTYGNGAFKIVQYDNRYRLTENKLISAGGHLLAHYSYAYDNVGNVTQIHEELDPRYNRDFAYDDLNRLVTANTGTALWQSGTYTYDAMGNLTKRSFGIPGTDSGLSLPRHHATSNVVSGQVDTLSIQYQGSTPLINVVTSTGVDHTVQYDAAGNETLYFAQRSYSARNLLSTVTDAASEDGTHRITYGYDGRGVRVSRTEIPNPGVTSSSRYFIYTPELHPIETTDDDVPNVWGQGLARTASAPLAANHLYVWFNDQPIAEAGPSRTSGGSGELSRHLPETNTFSAIFYTFTDHLGTPLLQMDANGAIVWRAEYEPYGNVYAMRAGARTDQPLRLPGQELAMNWEGAEENYNIFRWYRSGWGRYTQPDPVSPTGTNLYAYAFSMPTLTTDPTGLWGVQHREHTLLTPQPEALCGSPIACSKVSARVECKCGCPANDANPITAEPTLVIMGKIYINPGFKGKKVGKVDENVQDYWSALNHEYAYHINKAIDAVTPLLDALEKQTFGSQTECKDACVKAHNAVYQLFSETLVETQNSEASQ